MAERANDVIFRVAAATGLAVSLVLLAEYTGQAADLCGEGGGCDAVRASAYAHPFGLPMPLLGAAYFALLGLAAVWPRLASVRRPLALVGGVGALVLVGLQAFAIGAFCRFCLVADASALVAAATATGASAVVPRRRLALSAALTVLALAVPAVIVARAPAPPPPPLATTGGVLPEAVAREQRPGVLTIVEFTDFECPYCRRLHLALAEALRGVTTPVRVVRKMMPLPALHPHALGAALAWCCADAAGKGDAMADALVQAEDLTAAGTTRLAAGLGLGEGAFTACVASPSTRARVEADVSDADAAGVAGRLPTYWIGGTMYRGAKDAATLRRCIDDALHALPR